MALSDEDLLAQMKLQEESPDDPRQRKVAKQVFAKSDFTVDELTPLGERIWVRCISDAKPFFTDSKGELRPMAYWREYSVTPEEAVMLDERRFVVILHSRESMKPPKQEAPAKQVLQLKKGA
jgi:hypothetical protein